MNSGKADNQLNLALDSTASERERTLDLDVGYDMQTNTWELIVKYSGNLSRIEEELDLTVVELMNEYAIVTIPENLIDRLSEYQEVEFIEKPKRLFFSVNDGKSVSCINPVQTSAYNLTGEGVLVAVIDSGIDYSHPDFRNEDGTTRIIDLWDQTIPGNPPEGYRIGTLYSREVINEALSQRTKPEQLEIVPSVDISGHGTHVTGIAAGNGRASNGRNKGVAYGSELLIVKLSTSVGGSFPRTTQLMEAVDFVMRRAVTLGRPISINISFGNNYGSHDGNSLIENYLNDMSNFWKSSIIVGTGNEGTSAHHTEGQLENGRTEIVELAVGENERTMNLQLWKNYYDDFEVEIITPSGVRIGPIPSRLGSQRFVLGSTEILLYYGEPVPYNRAQEIYLEFLPIGNAIEGGLWTFRLVPVKIVVGGYDMWLPTGEVLGRDTRFLNPIPYTTLTIPSTAAKVITVAAYDGYTDGYAPFSGRGYTRLNMIKPDLTAPGVNILSASPGGGYTVKSGTSMAAPFVTGSAALLMQWGVVQGNDPYLYGEKMKAYLINGARQLRVENRYPNRTLGYGALCVKDSLPG